MTSSKVVKMPAEEKIFFSSYDPTIFNIYRTRKPTVGT
jgi:hypothetical protein